mgnify:CR=1 FL=1|jgi:putative peptidoglycan lipid II flippase
MFKSTAIISFFSIFGRISGYIRDVVIASYLGTGIYNDIFQACFRIPNFFRIIISEGITNLAFIPTYKSFDVNNNNSIAQKKNFTSSLFFFSLLIIVPIVLVIEIFMPQAINFFAPGFKNLDNYSLSILIARIIFPYTIFIVISSIFIGVLNSQKKFSITASIQIILNILICLALINFGNNQTDSIIAISYACLVSGFFQILILFYSIEKKFRVSFLVPKITKEIKQFLLILFPSFIIFFIFQFNKFLVYFLASYEVGAISYIYFSERIYQLPIGIISLSITTAMLPVITGYLQSNQFDEARNFFQKAFEYIMFFVIPSAFAFYFYSDLFVSTLFERGQFTNISTQNTANVLKVFAIGLPAYACIPIFTQFFIINNKIKLFLTINVIISLISLFLMIYLQGKNGYIGIIQGLIISYWGIFIAVVLYFFYDKFSFLTTKILYSIFVMFFSSIIMVIFLEYFLLSVELGKILTLFTIVTIGMIVYLLLNLIMNYQIINPIFNIILKRKK